MNRLFPILVVLLTATLLCAGNFEPPAAEYRLTEADRQQLQTQLAALRHALELKRPMVADALIVEVEIYAKAAEWLLRYPAECYTKAYLTNALAGLERGRARARELEHDPLKPAWSTQTGRLSRGYRSRVDGSVQPYGMVIPASYDGSKPKRLDVVLHGRGSTLTEVSFLAAHDSVRPIPPEQDYLIVEPFGRTNNVYRWAGETDVFEVIAEVRARYNIDPNRIVLRGFSMGGGGTWHLGLHYPHLWAAIEAGAGFTDTRRYAGQTRAVQELKPWQEPTLHIYDAADYALNAVNVPTVGYGGEDDAQLQATINIRDELARLGFRFIPDGLNSRTSDLRALFLVGPKTGHSFHPECKRQSDAFINEAVANRVTVPKRIRFVTYTTKYNECYWLTVDALERHYERAEVDASLSDDGRQLVIRTSNVARLLLKPAGQAQNLNVDGQAVRPGPAPRYLGVMVLEKREGKWSATYVPPVTLESERVPPRKSRNLQGPMDDAFGDNFLVVEPGGDGWHPAVQHALTERRQRFAAEWSKWMRGDVRTRRDHQVTENDHKNRHLILFGDPSNNAVLARVLPKLPIQWTKETLTVGKQRFAAAEHYPVLIVPNPLNPKKYVVLNSGHTFGEADFRGTNALLFPRLGDYAVLSLTGETKVAGLFDEMWRLK